MPTRQAVPLTMANHKSAIRRVRQTDRRRTVNTHNRARLRTQVKKLVEAADPELLPKTVSEIDRAVRKGVLHRNTAARMKARLSKRLSSSAPTA